MSTVKKMAGILFMGLLMTPNLGAAVKKKQSSTMAHSCRQLWENLKYYGGHALAFALPTGLSYKAFSNQTPAQARHNAQITLDRYNTLNQYGLMPRSNRNVGTTVIHHADHKTSIKHSYESPAFSYAQYAILNALDTQRMTDAELQRHITCHASVGAAMVGLVCMMFYNMYYETHKHPAVLSHYQS